MRHILTLYIFTFLLVCSSEVFAQSEVVKIYSVDLMEVRDVEKIKKSDQEWKKQLTKDQYHILRQKGTERAFTGKYHDHKGDGVYQCAACGTDLFDSKTKYDSGTGWPSYWEAVSKKNVAEAEDNSFFMKRTEVLCARCDSHLGHLFDDGPAPTSKRYCINSAALSFMPKKSG